jgi:hypothetical protein
VLAGGIDYRHWCYCHCRNWRSGLWRTVRGSNSTLRCFLGPYRGGTSHTAPNEETRPRNRTRGRAPFFQVMVSAPGVAVGFVLDGGLICATGRLSRYESSEPVSIRVLVPIFTARTRPSPRISYSFDREMPAVSHAFLMVKKGGTEQLERAAHEAAPAFLHLWQVQDLAAGRRGDRRIWRAGREGF